jgi:hypothetical protein
MADTGGCACGNNLASISTKARIGFVVPGLVAAVHALLEVMEGRRHAWA